MHPACASAVAREPTVSEPLSVDSDCPMLPTRSGNCMRLPGPLSVNGYRRAPRFAVSCRPNGRRSLMPGIDARPDLPEWNETRAREVITPHLSVQGGLLPALHAVQQTFGFIPGPAIALLAHEFNLSRAEVHGVATFYHDFRHGGPAGRHVLKLCRGEACQAV